MRKYLVPYLALAWLIGTGLAMIIVFFDVPFVVGIIVAVIYSAAGTIIAAKRGWAR